VIYVAASWRTKVQPEVVQWLRNAGHEVYDFRNPAPGVTGFAWREIDGGWENWSPEQYRAALRHPIAQLGFSHDENALHVSDTCVLVLPSGRSAHTEAGWMKGSGARVVVFISERVEPELMYLLFDEIALTKDELLEALGSAPRETPQEPAP